MTFRLSKADYLLRMILSTVCTLFCLFVITQSLRTSIPHSSSSISHSYSGFSSSASLSTRLISSTDHASKTGGRFDFSLNSGFNPFLRNRNTGVKWYDEDMNNFYEFVANQQLLTVQQEQQYGKVLKMWSHVKQVKEELEANLTAVVPADMPIPTISNEELAQVVGCSVTTLQKMEKYAEISKLKLVNSNLRLVLSVVSRYRASNIPNVELIIEGTNGLARAVAKFDYSRGFRFATYATWYVHQSVADYVRWRKNPTKIPGRYLLLLRKVKQYCTDVKEANGHIPNVAELSEALGASHHDIVKVLTMQLPAIMMCAPLPVKDPKQLGEPKDRTYEDIIVSDIQPTRRNTGQQLRDGMEKLLRSNLSEVERDVLRLRLGLDGGEVRPVKEVGQRFKISWKQVRNVEKNALGKLKASKEVKEFVESYNAVANV